MQVYKKYYNMCT